MTTCFGLGLHSAILRSYKPIPYTCSTISKHRIRISTLPISKTLHRTSTTTAVRINHNTRVNGPVSTLPAPLVLPSRAPNESFISFAFKRGKGYLNFYKTGLKNVYANYRLSRTLRTQISSKANSSISTAVQNALITRSDFQLLHRSSHDIRRIPLFLLVFVICGEFTPLVVLFMTGVVPTTCKIPKQVAKEREKIETRRKTSFRELDVGLPKEGGVAGKDGGVEDLSRKQLSHISSSLGLFSNWWPKALGLPLDSMLRRRVLQRKEYLEMDDTLITRDGGVSQMEIEEVRRACEERGIDVLGRNDEILKGTLRKWLEARGKTSIEKLLLTRPSVWAMKGS